MALSTNYVIIREDCTSLSLRSGQSHVNSNRAYTESEFVNKYNYKKTSGTASTTKIAVWGDYTYVKPTPPPPTTCSVRITAFAWGARFRGNINISYTGYNFNDSYDGTSFSWDAEVPIGVTISARVNSPTIYSNNHFVSANADPISLNFTTSGSSMQKGFNISAEGGGGFPGGM